MSTIKTAIAAVALAFALSTGAVAQTATGTAAPAPAATAPAATGAKAKTAAPRTDESIACSKEADAKNLHGAERKTFRAKCMKDAKAAKATVPAKKI